MQVCVVTTSSRQIERVFCRCQDDFQLTALSWILHQMHMSTAMSHTPKCGIHHENAKARNEIVPQDSTQDWQCWWIWLRGNISTAPHCRQPIFLTNLAFTSLTSVVFQEKMVSTEQKARKEGKHRTSKQIHRDKNSICVPSSSWPWSALHLTLSHKKVIPVIPSSISVSHKSENVKLQDVKRCR